MAAPIPVPPSISADEAKRLEDIQHDIGVILWAREAALGGSKDASVNKEAVARAGAVIAFDGKNRMTIEGLDSLPQEEKVKLVAELNKPFDTGPKPYAIGEDGKIVFTLQPDLKWTKKGTEPVKEFEAGIDTITTWQNALHLQRSLERAGVKVERQGTVVAVPMQKAKAEALLKEMLDSSNGALGERISATDKGLVVQDPNPIISSGSWGRGRPPNLTAQLFFPYQELGKRVAKLTPADPDVSPDRETPAPDIGGGRRSLAARKGMVERIANPGTMVGGMIGVLAGLFMGGPIGALLGVLLGALGGNMLSGQNPFEDKETATLLPTDTKVQVRDKDGNSPVMHLTVPTGIPGKTMVVHGKASADGTRFEVSSASLVTGGPGRTVTRQRLQLPLSLAVDKDGFITTAELYTQQGLPVPKALTDAMALPAQRGHLSDGELGDLSAPWPAEGNQSRWRRGAGK